MIGIWIASVVFLGSAYFCPVWLAAVQFMIVVLFVLRERGERAVQLRREERDEERVRNNRVRELNPYQWR